MDVATNMSTSMNVVPVSAIPEYWGYLATFITCLMFGSYFIPVKKFDAGDGVFFQWVQCCGIVSYGIVFNVIIGSPQFEPLAMIGGFMWATGNFVCTIIVRCIGMGVGQNMWSLVGMIIGWADGRFGWFGAATRPAIEWLQYTGIALSVVRGVLAAFIRLSPADDEPPRDSTVALEQTPRSSTNSNATGGITLIDIVRKASRAMSNTSTDYKDLDRETAQDSDRATSNRNVDADQIEPDSSPNSNNDVQQVEGDFLHRISPVQRQLLGLSLALFAGVNFGLQFATINSLKQEEGGNHSQSDMDYAFSFYCGSFVTSSVYTLIYAIAKRNRPVANVQLILPGFISGMMWALGQTGWFIANQSLSQSVSYPLVSAGPALVSLGWAVFLFHEIRGRNNIILLLIVLVLTIASVLMVALSM